jgi:predicted  nucleic acid-binding Zn-ribbon protein
MAVLSKFVALHRSNLKIQRYVEELKAAKEAQEQALNQQLATLVQSFEKAHAYGHAMAQEKQHLAALAESRLEQMEGLTQREAKLEVRLNNLNHQLDQARIAIYETQNTSKRELEIGKLDLEEDNKLLVAELNKVQEELEQFHIQNQQLQFKITQNEEKFSPKLFGAALQVKNELPYKLGAAIVSCKGSLKASLGLPFRLRRIVNEFETQSRSKLPLESSNYSQYIDFHEAEKIKQHLSYKFGEILIQTNGSIFKWITLPLRLNTAYQTWRKFRV